MMRHAALVLSLGLVVAACGSAAGAGDAGGATDGGIPDAGDAGTPDAGGACPTVPSTIDPSQAKHTPLATPGLSLPSTAQSHASDALVIAGYLDVTLYGADPTGAQDSTSAIQAALIDASGNETGGGGSSMVVYLPPGTYLVSNTLTGYQTFNGSNTNISNPKFGSIGKNGLLAPSLVGPANGPRPTIILKDGTFTDATNPQPVIHLVNTPNCDTLYSTAACGESNAPAVGDFAILFNAVLRDLDVRVGNNPGAIGVQFYSAQKSYMQNVSVDATGGYAAFQGAPATSVWVNIEGTGGQYGVIVDRTAGVSAIAGLTLSGQSVAGVQMKAIGDLAISGFDIEETNAAATGILAESGVPQGSTVSLVDGLLSVAGNIAITNSGGDSLYLENVFMQAAESLIVNQGSTTLAASGQVQQLAEYVHADQNTNASGQDDAYARANEIVVDGARQQTDVGPTFGSRDSAPADLVLRHLPGQMPWAFDAEAIWVTDYGADPTGFKDSTSAIRQAVAAAHANGGDEVFLPRGQYSISGTLQLYPNSRFFGLPGSYAELSAFGWVTGKKLEPFLRVGDPSGDPAISAAGRAVISDLAFYMPSNASSSAAYLALLPDGGAGYDPADQAYLSAIDWQVGRSSILNQVSSGFQYQNNFQNSGGTVVPSPPSRNIIQVDATGGGRWYGLQQAGDWGFNGASGNTLAVVGSSTPLTLYGSNPEHANGGAFYGFSNASNIRVLGMKSEDGSAPYMIDVTGSSNVMISGINGDGVGPIAFQASSDVNLNTLSYYEQYLASGQAGNYVTDGDAGYPFIDAYALIAFGSFDESPFPFCGDGVCDGAETAGNCPADCGSCQ